VPTIQNVSATNISTTGATLHADINPNNKETTYWFEYGTTPSLGQRTASQKLSSVQTVSSILSSLNANTGYYYRVSAENEKGRTYSAVLQFTTQNNTTGDTTAAPSVSTLRQYISIVLEQH
jgi:hypothetical protein